MCASSQTCRALQDLFEDLIARDEFQLEGMQVYSHILYIREDFAALSHLAHKAVLVDKYRHETCCIIGNYYSLKQQHHKARPPRTSNPCPLIKMCWKSRNTASRTLYLIVHSTRVCTYQAGHERDR